MDPYRTYYTDLGFERAELFEVLRKRYRCTDVLYPGCSIHITPSLFFPHVLSVDKSAETARFFAQPEPLLAYVNLHKNYKRSAYFRFIQQDYLEPLPLVEGSFDLLLALFAGGVSRSCKQYLKRGGLLVSNNHQDDAQQASAEAGLTQVATIRFLGGRYILVEGETNAMPLPVRKSSKHALRWMSGSVEYVERETYYVFERTSAV